MTEQILRLHQQFLHMPKISPILIMRHTKQSFEHCVQLCKDINLLRDADGIVSIVKIKYGRKSTFKFRRICQQ